MDEYYRMARGQVLAQLGADPQQGLTKSQVEDGLRTHGPNVLVERGLKSPWRIIWEQLTAVMVVILIVAAVVSLALGDFKDAIVIGAIVVINTLLGFSQEYRAEKAMAALKKMAVPVVKVRRGGRVEEISARDLVPGDIVLLEAGNVLPADCRLIEAANLRIQEAALTGESEAVEKDAALVASADLPLGDRRNMAYLGTVVTYGRGEAVVTTTGMATELGRIATLIQAVGSEATPLQRRLNRLGRILAVVALAIVAVIFVQGLLRGEELRLMFLTAVGMAVAAVPEGLAAVVTIALALGAQRMLKRQALIRKLAAVETLGSVTVICSDKTGTLTENRMTVTVLDVAGHRLDLNPTGQASPAMALRAAQHDRTLALLVLGGALCNDAVLQSDGEGQVPAREGVRVVGDPTEAALVMAAARLGLAKPLLEQSLPRVAELPFDSGRKLMTTVHALDNKSARDASLDIVADVFAGPLREACCVAFTKGAADRLLDVSASVWTGGVEPLTPAWRERIQAANDSMARDGMRVLGVGFRPLGSPAANTSGNSPERDLIFVGLIGMIDPPRAEARSAVETCRTAGIRTIMITGDHPLTASFIARDLGIAADARICTGPELDGMSESQLAESVNEVRVFARVSPEHKLKIVEALQARGHIVAMTGDGVNDAPALKRADIGVAMGIVGTDVSKEAADMVLLNDNFATIVAAVEEGRAIYDNIRKFIKYLLTTNTAEIGVMFVAPFLGMPLPLLPLQILWVNLVTDGFPALALGMEPAERNTMRRPPYRPDESVFSRGIGRHIIWVGLLMAALVLGTGYLYWRAGISHWQTMVFTTLALAQMAHVLAIRSNRDSLFRLGLLSNKPLLLAVVGTLVMQIAVVYVPALQTFFRTAALPLRDLLLCVLVSSVVFWAVEAEKWWTRRQESGSGAL